MPVQYDLPEYFAPASLEDVNKYNRLPYYLAMVEAKYFPEWQVFNSLFGKLTWQPNMGSTLRSVRAEPTPVGQQQFFPVDIDHTPQKNVYETLEFIQDTNLKMHDYDSKQFHFLPSFQDFRENQLDFNHKDIVRQIAISNDIFISSVLMQKTPMGILSGNLGGGPVQPMPIVPNGTSITAASVAASGKNTAFFINTAANISKGLTLACLDYAVCALRDDMGAPFFEGTINTPRDNELIKGKYVLLTSSEAWQMFKYDPNFQQFRNVNLNVVTDGFRGSIFDEVTTKILRYPFRFADDGTVPAPEIYDAVTGLTVRNPAYTAAPNEIAWLTGADVLKTIKVGPPPRAFAAKSMAREKFYSMRWNGEVQLTDQVLVQYLDPGTGTIVYDTNVRGRLLKLIGSVIYGAIPVCPHNCFPIAFKRQRPQIV